MDITRVDIIAVLVGREVREDLVDTIAVRADREARHSAGVRCIRHLRYAPNPRLCPPRLVAVTRLNRERAALIAAVRMKRDASVR